MYLCFNVGLPCTLYFVFLIINKGFCYKKKKKKKGKDYSFRIEGKEHVLYLGPWEEHLLKMTIVLLDM